MVAALLDRLGVNPALYQSGKQPVHTPIDGSRIASVNWEGAAEVEQQVEHRGNGACAAIGVGRIARKRDVGQLHGIEAGALVAKLALGPDHAEIVTADQVEIESDIVGQNNCIVDVEYSFAVGDVETIICPEVETCVLDNHSAAFDPGIPRVVASDSRGGQGGRSERCHNGQLPHKIPLSHAF